MLRKRGTGISQNLKIFYNHLPFTPTPTHKHNTNNMGCTASIPIAELPTEFNGSNKQSTYPIIGDREIMRRKAHGTSAVPVQQTLRWEVDVRRADRICNYNRHFAEPSGTFAKDPEFQKTMTEAKRRKAPIHFYDSNTGKLLYIAPVGRTHDEFWRESKAHGWPSFRDEEVYWENVRCLKNGEAVSLDGTHLGHNLPDQRGNRYCINLCCIAGRPTAEETVGGSESGSNVDNNN
eukprot:Nitzschia sp. Nitz4//scaffold61_size107673//25247//26118//NITZ4_004226-RA/size107673-snap-gene-0.107-mRNA-1//-1//CDS//3329555683//8158//frame0